MAMRLVRVVYDHEEGGGWTAESPDASGYIAYAETFEELRPLAHAGLRFHFAGEPIIIDDPTMPLVNAGPADQITTEGQRPGVPGEYRGKVGPLRPVAA
jgi:predicted RNase H-like HicB family nuclease